MKRDGAGRDLALSIVRLSKVPRKGEYVVELSDGYGFRVTAEQVLRFGLEAGRTLGAEEIPGLEKAYAVAAARKAALRLLRVRPRATGELRRDLARRNHGAEAIDETLAGLEAAGLLDDRLFARLWVRERTEKKGFGKRRIASELYSKGISREIVEEELEKAFDRAGEVAVAERTARRRAARLGDLPLETRKRRIYTYLLRSGFTSDIAAEAAKSVTQPYSGEEDNDHG